MGCLASATQRHPVPSETATMGIMPVTGIPLPFVSYGGSSAVTSFIAVGIALSVHMRRFTAGIDAEVGRIA